MPTLRHRLEYAHPRLQSRSRLTPAWRPVERFHDHRRGQDHSRERPGVENRPTSTVRPAYLAATGPDVGSRQAPRIAQPHQGAARYRDADVTAMTVTRSTSHVPSMHCMRRARLWNGAADVGYRNSSFSADVSLIFVRAVNETVPCTGLRRRTQPAQ